MAPEKRRAAPWGRPPHPGDPGGTVARVGCPRLPPPADSRARTGLGRALTQPAPAVPTPVGVAGDRGVGPPVPPAVRLNRSAGPVSRLVRAGVAPDQRARPVSRH